MKATTLINGRKAIILHDKSRSNKIISLCNFKVMSTLEILLSGNRSRKHEAGLTTLRATQTMEFNNLIGTTRVSNLVIPLRKELPKGAIITFRYVGEKQGRYAIINDKKFIDVADKLVNEIRKKISKEV